MSTFTDAVDVVSSEQGIPLQLLWRGVLYEVAPHPLCWYERRPWWNNEARLPPGAGAGAVDTQIWRLALQAAGAADSFTLDVVHYRPGGRWRVIKIYEAVDQAVAAEPWREEGDA